VMPCEHRNQVLELGHEGHPGIVQMKQHLRSNVWWPGMDKDIESFVNRVMVVNWSHKATNTNR